MLPFKFTTPRIITWHLQKKSISKRLLLELIHARFQQRVTSIRRRPSQLILPYFPINPFNIWYLIQPFLLQIVITVLVGACLAQGPQGRRHPQNDDQPQQNYQPAPQQQQQQYQDRPRSHESTTYIPIIRFDKEQGSDGSYKALYVFPIHFKNSSPR